MSPESPFAGASANRHVSIDAFVCANEVCQRAELLIWDGDSFIVQIQDRQREKIRLENIDAPEIDGRCAAERSVALRSKEELARLLDGRRVELRRSTLDRYGRQLALVLADGQDVGEALIAQGIVRRWDGRRKPWC